MSKPKPGEWAKRIYDLRTALGFSQERFAQEFQSTQGAISVWEKGDEKYSPSAEVYIRLGNVAAAANVGHDPTWFWEQAGLEISSIEPVIEKRLKARGAAPTTGEVIRVLPLDIGLPHAAGTPNAEELGLALPARFVPNPASTKYVVVGGRVQTSFFAKEDTLVIDASVTSPAELWNRVVLADLDPREQPNNFTVHWPEGYFVGRLRCRAEQRGDSTWTTELCSPADEIGAPGEPLWTHGEAIVVGYRRYQFSDAQLRKLDQNERKRILSGESKEALSKPDLFTGCRILGRMVCWFSSEPSAESAAKKK